MPRLAGHTVKLRSIRDIQDGDIIFITAKEVSTDDLDQLRNVVEASLTATGIQAGLVVSNFDINVKAMSLELVNELYELLGTIKYGLNQDKGTTTRIALILGEPE